MRSAIAELASPMRGRSSKTSTAPRTSPRTPATPIVGCMRAAAICSSVVLPAPLGPSTTQRSPSSTSQVTSSTKVDDPRRTVTPAKARTSLMPRPYGTAAMLPRATPSGLGPLTPTYDVWMSELPASVRLALWVTAAWRGELPTKEALTRSFPDLDHVAGDLARLDVWRDLGEGALFVALPRAGDTSGMPRASGAATAHAAEAGECVYVAGIGGLLVPTLTSFGPEGDVGHRIDWTAYEAEPVPRHRLEMLDLRDVERTLLTRLAEHTTRLAEIGGQPWGQEARAAAQTDLDTKLWGVPRSTPGRAL